ncbi:MAG: c-type cytochrome [Devosiaceae bacterium]|nr:c-type cytochrome [Devosiaceae bacterium]
MRSLSSRFLPKFTAPLAMAALASLVFITPASAQANVINGASVFNSCAGCHKVGDDAQNASGPVLTDVIGRVAGTYEGYRFSNDLIAAGEAGLVWDEENLAQFIADPSGFLKEFLDDSGARSKMPFRLRDENNAADVAAFLASLN